MFLMNSSRSYIGLTAIYVRVRVAAAVGVLMDFLQETGIRVRHGF